MGHKIANVSKTKFNNALRKSLSENKAFLLKLEKEEKTELRWMQNQSNTNSSATFEISMTPISSSVSLNDNTIDVTSISGEIISQSNTSQNRNVQILKV